MKLTPEQEASLLEQYDCYIRSVVKEIRARGGYRNDFEEEDLMQEGRLAFLLHLRRMNSMDDILFCKRNILAAMWSYWRRMALVSIPHNKYKEEIRKVHRVNWRDAMIEIELREENRCETSALIQDFLSRQEEHDRTVLRMKLEGYKNREIIPIVHAKGESQMSRMLSRIRKKAAAYFAQ